MIQLIDRPVSIGPNGPQPLADAATLEAGREKTIAYGILNAHNTTNVPGSMKLKLDSQISHDIT